MSTNDHDPSGTEASTVESKIDTDAQSDALHLSGASLKSATVAAVGWAGISQVTTQLLQFVFVAVFAHILSPRDFGLVAMILVFTGFQMMLGELGVEAALVQRKTVTDRELSSVFWVNIGLNLVLMAITISAAPLIADFYGNHALVRLLVLASVSLPITSIGANQRAVLMRGMNFKRLAVVETVSVLIGGVVGIIMATQGAGAISLVTQGVVTSVAGVFLVWWSVQWRPSATIHWGDIRSIAGFSLNLLGFNTINYWARNADNLLVGKFLGSKLLGIYSRAYQIMLLPVYQVAGFMGRAMFSSLSRIQEDRERVRNVYLRAVSAIAFLTFPMMLGAYRC